MTQLQLQFVRSASPHRPAAPRRRRRTTLRQELDAAMAAIARLSPAARLERANRELLQQRRHD